MKYFTVILILLALAACRSKREVNKTTVKKDSTEVVKAVDKSIATTKKVTNIVDVKPTIKESEQIVLAQGYNKIGKHISAIYDTLSRKLSVDLYIPGGNITKSISEETVDNKNISTESMKTTKIEQRDKETVRKNSTILFAIVFGIALLLILSRWGKIL